MFNQVMKFVAKDFYVQKKTLKTYALIGLILAVFFSFTNRDQHSMVVAVVAFPIIYGFINKTLYEDEKNNTLRFLVSLPMKRDIIVYSRYLSVALVSILVALIMVVLNNLLIAAGVWKSAGSVDNLIVLATIYIFVIMISIYLPMAFKLGYIKAAGINRFVFIGLLALGGVVGVAIGGLFQGNPPEFIRSLDSFISNLDISVLAIVPGVLVLGIYLLSMGISVKVFRKRDLFR